MWIRSQDNMTLTEMKELDIDGANQIWSGVLLIGKYSTVEKAMDVLNLIEKCLTEYHSNYVFYIPQDKEIDEF